MAIRKALSFCYEAVTDNLSTASISYEESRNYALAQSSDLIFKKNFALFSEMYLESNDCCCVSLYSLFFSICFRANYLDWFITALCWCRNLNRNDCKLNTPLRRQPVYPRKIVMQFSQLIFQSLVYIHYI